MRGGETSRYAALMTNTNWKLELTRIMALHGDSLSKAVGCTLSDAELEEPFHRGYGSVEGKPFTLWTTTRVYFPWQYDGAEGVSSVPRDPNGEATDHIGG